MSVGDNVSIFKDLYQYRELLKTSIKKEIRGKYKGSFLGVLWSFINPLLMVMIYAVVFPLILKVQQENYVIFLVVGLIPWNFFTTSISQGTTTILHNANIIKKVYFPREILPVSVVTSATINFFISCIIILIFILFSNIGFSWNLLLLPIVVIVQYTFTLGLVFILSAVNIYIRDAEYIVNFLTMMFFYVTPIIYSSSMIPEEYQWILQLNPMTHIIGAYRDIFYYKQLPELGNLFTIALFSFMILILGYTIFKKLSRGFAEEV